MITNHTLAFPTLIGGVQITRAIFPGQPRPRVGSIGAIVEDAGGARFILSNAHVLCDPAGGRAVGDGIYQPVNFGGRVPCAKLSRWDDNLDCAVAAIVAGQSSAPEILGLGLVAQPVAAVVGMRVVKSGRETGITEGEVARVAGTTVIIRPFAGHAPAYELSDEGDSGSLWVTCDGRQPVALHAAGNLAGAPEEARGPRIEAVLAALGVHFP